MVIIIKKKNTNRLHLNTKFREKIFNIASEKEGGEPWLGRKLGYSINFGYRVRQLKKGEVSLSYEQLKTLSKITGIKLNEIMKYIKE